MGSSNKQYLKKRKYQRLEFQEVIRLYGSEGSFEDYNGNLSNSGLMLVCGRKFEIGQELKVAIRHFEKGFIDYECTVRRCNPKVIDLENTKENARHYFCFDCEYKAYKENSKNGIQWITENSSKETEIFDYIQKDPNDTKTCPECLKKTFYP